MIIGKVPDFAKDQEDSFFPQDLIRPKDSIGSTKKICARVIFGNNLGRRGFSDLSNLYFGEEGVELTLFQWSIELFVHCEDISPGALSLTIAKTLKDSVEIWEKSKTLVATSKCGNDYNRGV